jgi:hypothetical protein
VVEAKVARIGPRARWATGGALAAGFLVAMAVTGQIRESGSLVRFEAAGLMKEPPERIDRVEVETGARRFVFVRTAESAWTQAEPPAALRAPLASHLAMSLRFIHVTAPVRAMAREEYQGATLSEFGLEPPRYVVRLLRAGRPVLAARFGSDNPQELMQYVQVEGRDELYLLPRFVGREWEQLIDGAGAR